MFQKFYSMWICEHAKHKHVNVSVLPTVAYAVLIIVLVVLVIGEFSAWQLKWKTVNFGDYWTVCNVEWDQLSILSLTDIVLLLVVQYCYSWTVYSDYKCFRVGCNSLMQGWLTHFTMLLSVGVVHSLKIPWTEGNWFEPCMFSDALWRIWILIAFIHHLSK